MISVAEVLVNPAEGFGFIETAIVLLILIYLAFFV